MCSGVAMHVAIACYEPAPVLAMQIVYIYRMAQLFIVAFAAATLFLRTRLRQNTLDDGRPYLGAIL